MDCCKCSIEPEIFILKQDKEHLSRFLFMEVCPKCEKLNIELHRITYTGDVLEPYILRGEKAEKFYDKLEKEIARKVVMKFPKGTNQPNWRVGEYLKTVAYSSSLDGCRQHTAFKSDRVELPELKIFYV